jgi:PKD repeat protein
VGPSPSPRPVIATWTGRPLVGDRPHQVDFDGRWTGGDRWRIDFGDGKGTAGTGNSVAVRNNYSREGVFVATLVVTGSGGTTRAIVEITVLP